MTKPIDRENYNKIEKDNEPPVYKIIGDFPSNKDFPVGETIRLHHWRSSSLYWSYTVSDCQGDREYLSDFFDKYPNIFKKIDPYVNDKSQTEILAEYGISLMDIDSDHFNSQLLAAMTEYADQQTQSLRSQLEAIENLCITSGPLTAEEIVNKVAAIAQAALKE